METAKQPIYPVEPWTITETEFDMDSNYRNETTFALSNGYIGTRGTLEEGYDLPVNMGLEGNFINGFYESENIRYGEWNFGFPTQSQSLLNLPNLKTIRLILDGEPMELMRGTVERYRRTLNMKEGVVTRFFTWCSPKGKKVEVQTRRFVSLADKNIMAICYQVTPLNFDGELTLESVLDGEVENHTRVTNPLVDYGPFGSHLLSEELEFSEQIMYYQGHTKNSGLTMACGSVQNITKGKVRNISDRQEENRGILEYKIRAKQGESVCMEKIIAYTSSLDMEPEELKSFIMEKLKRSSQDGYRSLEMKHIECVETFYNHADVVIEGDDALQQGIRFNLFHIMQAAGRDGKTGMGAKGLTGEGYEGHYFWDTEMYILPVFIYTAPELAKKLLDYRFHTLEEARARARVLGHPTGALYPWRTINGQEASTYFPLGTAQYHINADIAYAFWLYVTVTGDLDYLERCAAEVLCETARVWADVGSFAECRDGRYCICAVTGPDEYNAIVDNNFYTNLMAREHLRSALEALELLKAERPGAFNALKEKISLGEEETKLWNEIADKMYLPYDEKRRVYPLDDGFLMRKPWDDSKIATEKRHLLYENFHPLFIYRQQMSKQADAILGMYLHSNLFTEEELRRNYDFYQEVTLHHSSLSTCIFGILACQIGYYEEAYTYFSQSARMDLDDYHNNVYAGIHAANMAGTWQAIVNGFAGMRTNRGYLEINPYLPPQWNSYSFPITYREHVLEITIEKNQTKVTLKKGRGLTLTLCQKEVTLLKEGDTACETI